MKKKRAKYDVRTSREGITDTAFLLYLEHLAITFLMGEMVEK